MNKKKDIVKRFDEKLDKLKDFSDYLDEDTKLVRSTLVELLDDSKEVIKFMTELARESEHPRCAEVLGQLIKQNADIAEMLLKTHGNRIKIDQMNNPSKVTGLPGSGGGDGKTVIMTTTELQRMIQDEKKDYIDVTNSGS